MLKRGILLLALLAAAQPVGAQSLFGVRGLGVPVDPIDPRGRALGSSGLGLLGLNTSMVNPAELAGIRRRGVVAALQPFYGSEELAGGEDNVSGTRFPLIQLLYPARQQLVIGLGFGGVLEQSWSSVTEIAEPVGNDTVDVREFLGATGALTQVRLTIAHELTPSVSLGIAGGVYAGGLERELTRVFLDSATSLLPFTRLTNWEYRGTFATLGVSVDPFSTTRLAASVMISSNIKAVPRHENGTRHSYDMPMRFSLGGSTLLSSRLLAAGSAQYTTWKEGAVYTPPGTSPTLTVTARPTWDVGAGLEWEQLRTARRVFPLRAGFRFSQLPFHQTDEEPAKEVSGSLGVGLRLVADEFGPLAMGDIGLERGRRTGWAGPIAGGLTENFWRFTASITLFGR